MRAPSRHTAAVHAGADPDAHLGALSPPIYQTSLHRLPDAARGSAIHEGHEPGYFYGRIGNPTQHALERALAELEGGEAALALASGMGAIAVAAMGLLKAGDHAVVPELVYPSTEALFRGLLGGFGVEVSFVDATKPERYAQAARPNTKLFYIETPSNPTLQLVDLAAVADIARERGVVTVADNTFATPFNQRPLEHGVDVVVHSATKFLGGHGDLLAGALVGSSDFVERARWQTNKVLGAVVAPQTAWLVLRGLRTLAVRMERHNANALAVAEFLEGHPKVTRVHHPGLASHPQRALAGRQMDGFGGVLSFDVGEAAAACRLVERVRLCTLAVSLGDVASLIQHPASMTGAQVPRAERLARGIGDGLIRLSVGIEDCDDIIDDLKEALTHV